MDRKGSHAKGDGRVAAREKWTCRLPSKGQWCDSPVPIPLPHHPPQLSVSQSSNQSPSQTMCQSQQANSKMQGGMASASRSDTRHATPPQAKRTKNSISLDPARAARAC